MEDVGQAINVTNYYLMEGEVRREGAEPVSKTTPVFRNIAASNMTISGARIAINIEGLPEMPITGLRISDVIANAKTGMKAFHTAGLELHNVQINAVSGPAFLVKDSRELELDHVSSRKPAADAPVVRLDRCAGAVVRDSRAFARTGTFLSVGAGELKMVVMQGLVTGAVKKVAEESAKNYWTTEEPSTEADRPGR
jgi:hypothetical protein